MTYPYDEAAGTTVAATTDKDGHAAPAPYSIAGAAVNSEAPDVLTLMDEMIGGGGDIWTRAGYTEIVATMEASLDPVVQTAAGDLALLNARFLELRDQIEVWHQKSVIP